MTERTAIVGLGVTGLSVLQYLRGRGEGPLLVVDTRETPPNAAVRAVYPDVEFRFGARQLDDVLDRVVVSPGVALSDPLLTEQRQRGVPLVSDIDLFCAAATAPVFAITGTNGKSTVTALTAHMLNRLGWAAAAGGNLGRPALDLLSQPQDCFVLELSSFQLERMAPRTFEAATILNVSEDHVDRHGGMENYVAAKQRIYRRADRAVCNRQDPHTFPEQGAVPVMSFGLDAPAAGHYGIRERGGQRGLAFGDSCVAALSDLPLTGVHNHLNLMAACALLHDRQPDPERLVASAAGFTGLPHRCVLIAVQGGVRYINDSKATNVGATLAAIAGLAEPGRALVLIAGGEGKGADFAPLAAALAEGVRAVVLLGRAAPELEAVLRDVVATVRVEDLPAAVAAAARIAEPGDTVLLSPACASLDMFENYAARGDAFAAAVRELAP